MVSVMVPPAGTVVAGVNTRTGVTGLPDTWVPRVMDVKAVILVAGVIPRALTPAVKVTS
jgi:hypothetical protein